MPFLSPPAQAQVTLLPSQSPSMSPPPPHSGRCVGPHRAPPAACPTRHALAPEAGLQEGRPLGLYQGSLQEEYGCNALDLVGGQPAVPAAAAEAALGLRVQVELGAEDAVLPACLVLSQAGVVLRGERRRPLTRCGCGCGWAPSAGPPPALWSHWSLPGRPLTSCRKERVSCSWLSCPWSR